MFLPKVAKISAVSLLGLMLLAMGTLHPAAAIVGPTPPATFTMTENPSYMDPSSAVVHGGDLWVADAYSNHIYEYSSPFSVNEVPLLTLTTSGAWQLAFDSAGNLWVGSGNTGQVVEFAAPITNGEAVTVTLSGMAPDSSGVLLYQGNLWVTTVAGDVYEYSPEPTTNMAVAPAPTLTGLGYSVTSAFDSSGNLWVASSGGVLQFASPIHTGESSSYTLNLPGGKEGVGIAFDGAGNLWVSSESSGQLSEFKAPLTSGESGTSIATIPTGDSWWGLSIDSSANIWIADFTDKAIYEFSGLASPFSVGTPVTLPPTIPQHLLFNFQNGKSILGNEVSFTGVGVIYNLPGFNAATDLYPNTFADCLNAGAGTITITGFTAELIGPNATEILVYSWFSTTTSAQGWPTEPSC